MKFPDDVKTLIERKFQRHHQNWLTGSSASWPLIINLNVPSDKQASAQNETLRSWITAWKKWENRNKKRSAASLVWVERNWRSLGTQRVPQKLTLHCAEEAVVWIDKADEWETVVKRYAAMVRQWQVLSDVLAKQYRFLADCKEEDFLSLMEMLQWISDNPQSNLYPRQIPLAGIDSKWLESHKNMVTKLVSVIKNEDSSDFFKACGLKAPPQLMRMRILDPNMRSATGGLCDISMPWEEAAAMAIEPACVFIVENLQSGLAFSDLPGSVVIMGLGYNVELLRQLPWLHKARCMYWGDIDTHGFAILSRARKFAPHLESILMDESALFDRKRLWVREEKQYVSMELPLLSQDEQRLYNALKSNIWGHNVRLEQERICWSKAWKIISEIASTP